MRIAFDAKRAFRNKTGLGQYSRNLLNAMFEHYPEYSYHLMTPKEGKLFTAPKTGDIHIGKPKGLYKSFPSLWRSSGVRHELRKREIDIYHGLSHEIPFGLKNTGVKSVVTMHDLIFERYPHQYNLFDVMIYRRKFKYACNNADLIIAISQQTKQDLQDFYKIPEHKIRVCYQSCNQAFTHILSKEQLNNVRQKYNLPERFLLSVGSIIERKNLLNVCKALQLIKANTTPPPLVVVGTGGKYMTKVKQYINEHGLQVLLLNEHKFGFEDEDLPAIYQAATAMIYPSVYEGFGIPILEAFNSRLPVITSNLSCMPETGGDAAYYIDPLDVNDIARSIQQVVNTETLHTNMIEKGLLQAQKFTPQKCATSVMSVFKEVL